MRLKSGKNLTIITAVPFSLGLIEQIREEMGDFIDALVDDPLETKTYV
jgi:hypothetical protein